MDSVATALETTVCMIVPGHTFDVKMEKSSWAGLVRGIGGKEGVKNAPRPSSRPESGALQCKLSVPAFSAASTALSGNTGETVKRFFQ